MVLFIATLIHSLVTFTGRSCLIISMDYFDQTMAVIEKIRSVHPCNSPEMQVGGGIEPPPPPDGGIQAWAQVLSGHLVVALTWGYASSFGVFQNYYEATLPQSPSDISWIGGFQVFCLLFISTLSGRATDAGLARPVVLAGGILLLLGTFMTSLATEYWQIFLSQGLCIGLGQGLMWLPSVTLISTYFIRKRVFAVTAAATGTSTGGVIFPAMIQHLTPRIGGLLYSEVIEMTVLVLIW
jgi:MFS transporter, MCT family, solute carrier family 16 (monocarboxylic acid transporters), member 3